MALTWLNAQSTSGIFLNKVIFGVGDWLQNISNSTSDWIQQEEEETYI